MAKKTKKKAKRSRMSEEKRQKLLQKTKERAQQSTSKSSSLFNLPEGVEEFKPKNETYRIDHLPYVVSVDNNPEVEKGDEWYERTYFVHYNIGPDDLPRVCPQTIGNPCPLCEEYKRLKKLTKGNDKKKEEYKDLIDAVKPKKKQLFNIIDADDPDKGVQLFDYSTFLYHDRIMEEVTNDDEKAGFWMLEGGFTIEARFKKESFQGSPFYKCTRVDFQERDDYDEDILDDVLDLDKVLSIPDYKELEKELMGLEESSDDDDEEEAEEVKPKRSTKKSKKKSRKEEIEYPESQEELDDMDKDELKELADELEISTKGTEKILRKRIIDHLDLPKAEEEEEEDEEETDEDDMSGLEEDEEDEEEEEEEEVKPKRSTKKKSSSKKETPKKSSRTTTAKKGKGKKKDEEDEEEKPKKGAKKKASSSTAKKKKKKKSSKEPECPAGGVFGRDVNEFDICEEECDLWPECRMAAEEEEED